MVARGILVVHQQASARASERGGGGGSTVPHPGPCPRDGTRALGPGRVSQEGEGPEACLLGSGVRIVGVGVGGCAEGPVAGYQ